MKTCPHTGRIVEAMKAEILEDAVGGVIPTTVRSLKEMEEAADPVQYGLSEKSEAIRDGHGYDEAHKAVDEWLKSGALKDVKIVPFGTVTERSRETLRRLSESLLSCASIDPTHPLMAEICRATRRRPREIVEAAEAVKVLLV